MKTCVVCGEEARWEVFDLESKNESLYFCDSHMSAGDSDLVADLQGENM